jgi:hypothetical protein
MGSASAPRAHSPRPPRRIWPLQHRGPVLASAGASGSPPPNVTTPPRRLSATGAWPIALSVGPAAPKLAPRGPDGSPEVLHLGCSAVTRPWGCGLRPRQTTGHGWQARSRRPGRRGRWAQRGQRARPPAARRARRRCSTYGVAAATRDGGRELEARCAKTPLRAHGAGGRAGEGAYRAGPSHSGGLLRVFDLRAWPWRLLGRGVCWAARCRGSRGGGTVWVKKAPRGGGRAGPTLRVGVPTLTAAKRRCGCQGSP